MIISGKTKIFGVVGYPITHTLSPLIHNTLFKEFKIDAIYLPFEVLPENFEKFFYGLKSINNFTGLNVTLPFKNVVAKYLNKKIEHLLINTVLFKNGLSYGYNTDIYGFKMGLIKNYPEFKIKNSNVLIIGAGGASYAVLCAILNEKPKKIVITNRTIEKAEELKNYFCKSQKFKNIDVMPLKSDILFKVDIDFDLIVNTTSVGLKNEKSLIEFKKCNSKQAIVYDLIYNPPLTDFLKQAKKKGYKIINGLDMLIFQAFKAFSIWTDKDPSKFYEKISHYLLKCF